MQLLALLASSSFGKEGRPPFWETRCLEMTQNELLTTYAAFFSSNYENTHKK